MCHVGSVVPHDKMKDRYIYTHMYIYFLNINNEISNETDQLNWNYCARNIRIMMLVFNFDIFPN